MADAKYFVVQRVWLRTNDDMMPWKFEVGAIVTRAGKPGPELFPLNAAARAASIKVMDAPGGSVCKAVQDRAKARLTKEHLESLEGHRE